VSEAIVGMGVCFDPLQDGFGAFGFVGWRHGQSFEMVAKVSLGLYSENPVTSQLHIG
jgi:hypothetical protein